MDSDSDEDILTYRRMASELLTASSLEQLHGDWEAAARLRRYGLAMLYNCRPRFSLPRVRSDMDGITDDTWLFYYRFTHRKLRRLQASYDCRTSFASVPTPVLAAVASKVSASCCTTSHIRIGSYSYQVSTVAGRVL
ncbi:hypothetical protein PHYPSEUDO_014444 [Phytophthora pseudosyringae]|uniref:Uncharacterized protein n=1 Tax=Phytophthora pseudosyringae TaxID=221518 RepID=A0A8T1V7Q5_9STRA|nr:hypothetical protein PHYPSEUDO_014444 [Phytophthora pseudosyringae]